jgi:diadenosine tetraphosphate (Ap4A) HIT family hydrolase
MSDSPVADDGCIDGGGQQQYIVPSETDEEELPLSEVDAIVYHKPSRPDVDEGLYQRAPNVYYTPSDSTDFETHDYKSNPTVFGKILRGRLKTRLILETKRLVAIEDISQRAPFHALVLPKQRIGSVLDLTGEHLELLEEMRAVAEKYLLGVYQLLPHSRGDYKLCFHVPPFHSVDHLHLHVLAPASSVDRLYRKFDDTLNQGNRWNVSLQTVTSRLRNGMAPTLYERDDRWTPLFSNVVSCPMWGVLFPPFEEDAKYETFRKQLEQVK